MMVRIPWRFGLQRASLLAMLLATAAASAAEITGHEHAALPVDEALTLSAALDDAYSLYPATIELNARNQQASAWTDRGDGWLAERPSLMLRYQSDQLLTDRGLSEYEAGIALPLWSWGGRRAVQVLGESMSAESALAELAVRWELAGFLRSSLWEIALAENEHELAGQALESAVRLTALVKRRHELGDVALSDVLHAESFYLEAQTRLIEVSAVLLDAERMYRSVTGLERRPPFSGEVLSELDEVTTDHPALAFANSAVSRAEAGLEVAREAATAGTTVLVGVKSERSAFANINDDSIGVTLSIPFGGSSTRQTEISAASRIVANARAERASQTRTLTRELHEAAHGLSVVRENLATSTARMQLVEKHLAMGESAYEKGEIDLIDLLKLQANALSAKRQLARLMIDERRLTALYNQAVGVLP